jgi:transcriptional regulator with GAF, ATPase, and Fis domain
MENVIERALILSPGSVLTPGAFFLQTQKPVRKDGSSPRLEDIEREHILHVLTQCDWRIKGTDGAAKRLDMNPSTLRYRMKKLGIERR